MLRSLTIVTSLWGTNELSAVVVIWPFQSLLSPGAGVGLVSVPGVGSVSGQALVGVDHQRTRQISMRKNVILVAEMRVLEGKKGPLFDRKSGPGCRNARPGYSVGAAATFFSEATVVSHDSPPGAGF